MLAGLCQGFPLEQIRPGKRSKSEANDYEKPCSPKFGTEFSLLNEINAPGKPG